MRCIAADLVNTWMVRWLVKLIIFILKRRKSLSHFQWVSFLYLDLHQESECVMQCDVIWYDIIFTAKIIHTSPKRKLYGLTFTHFYSFLTWFITWLLLTWLLCACHLAGIFVRVLCKFACSIKRDFSGILKGIIWCLLDAYTACVLLLGFPFFSPAEVAVERRTIDYAISFLRKATRKLVDLLLQIFVGVHTLWVSSYHSLHAI